MCHFVHTRVPYSEDSVCDLIGLTALPFGSDCADVPFPIPVAPHQRTRCLYLTGDDFSLLEVAHDRPVFVEL